MFDSGVGGLTVLHATLVRLPHEDVAYLGDTGRFPYGPRSRDELIAYARELTGILVERGAKVVVVACNSATAAALPTLQRESPVPVLGVVTPEARAAVQATRNRRVGVLATEATVASGRYVEAIHDLDAGVEVVQVACPGLAEAIQGGEPYSERTLELAQTACAPLREAGVDTVVLGCTHYPLLTGVLSYVMGDGVTLVSSAEETAKDVYRTLVAEQLVRDPTLPNPVHRFMATGDPAEFQRLGRRFLGPEVGTVAAFG